jgi:hypothetical protein
MRTIVAAVRQLCNGPRKKGQQWAARITMVRGFTTTAATDTTITITMITATP